ncbi:deoxynucleotide monophosphate kinase family protein [Streptomyces sp. MJM1172]|uniref:deoxynucleotide monophosphate kinase family protein n=1 Tax=Streptomyces sp. MJM1172 TaxID=1703926 RepID=UPI0009398E9B|nr:hypothetical protein [Streptomyces sp. MJM1172]OKI71410.1 hypothetical protein AMK15_01925 [Streptomyces sp. MJM1172]
MRDIAIIGRARSGKDSVGARLVQRYGYTRLAFADPLKDMALEINPVIPTVTGVHVRLAPLVEAVGWEYAKDTYPEVRRILQHVGQSVRDRDPDYWIRALTRTAVELEGGPIVVTDVRYPNEAMALSRLGFRLVRVIRPALGDPSPDAHESETALDDQPIGVTIVNGSTLEELYAHADSIAL